jgi:hypothetical protein
MSAAGKSNRKPTETLLVVLESPDLGMMILAPIHLQTLPRTKDGRNEPLIVRPQYEEMKYDLLIGSKFRSEYAK